MIVLTFHRLPTRHEIAQHERSSEREAVFRVATVCLLVALAVVFAQLNGGAW